MIKLFAHFMVKFYTDNVYHCSFSFETFNTKILLEFVWRFLLFKLYNVFYSRLLLFINQIIANLIMVWLDYYQVNINFKTYFSGVTSPPTWQNSDVLPTLFSWWIRVRRFECVFSPVTFKSRMWIYYWF